MIIVGATVASWKCDGSELDWLRNAEAMREASPVPLEFFCAVQMSDDRSDAEAFTALFERLGDLGPDTVTEESASWWCFKLDDGFAWRRSTRGRLIGITTGRNLIREKALRDTDASHVLFLDTDVEPDPDCIPKLLELDHPVAGGDVPHYCLHGPPVMRRLSDNFRADVDPPVWREQEPLFPFPVQEHWNTAGFLLVRRDVLRQVAWRWECDTDVTDDPSFALDVERAGFGKTWVRKDVIGKHAPLVPVEARR